MQRSLVTLALAIDLVACGGSGEPAKAAEGARVDDEPASSQMRTGDEASSSADEAAAEDSASAKVTLPADCASTVDGVCLPPRRFVERLCQDVYPNIALVLFRDGTPWTRAYLTRKTEAWNAAGGASISGWLEFDEEVIVLKHRKAAKGGMQVSGAGGGYEAIRWNGACVTLSGEEVTLRRPPNPKYAKVEWKWIEESMREALKADTTVRDAYIGWRKECKGVTMGTVSKKCVTADARLSQVIAEFVAGGGTLAEPEKLPE